MVEKQRKKSAQVAMPATLQISGEIQKLAGLGKVCTLENPCESSMKNSIGKRNAAQPYEGKLHVRFDEWPQWNWGADSLKGFIIFEIKLEGHQALLYAVIKTEFYEVPKLPS